MKCIYEKPQQKELCCSLLTVIATSWNDGHGNTEQVDENSPGTQDDREYSSSNLKSRGWNGWDVFGE